MHKHGLYWGIDDSKKFRSALQFFMTASNVRGKIGVSYS